MKNEQLYNDTVNIILDAYNERKLRSGYPCGCFIGNIVAKRCPNLPQILHEHDESIETWNAHWFWYLCDKRRGDFATGVGIDEDEAIRQIDATGYSLEEVNELEKAFEYASNRQVQYMDEEGLLGPDWDEHYASLLPEVQLAGMTAALTKLAEIHETKEDESLRRLNEIHEKIHGKKEVILENSTCE